MVGIGVSKQHKIGLFYFQSVQISQNGGSIVKRPVSAVDDHASAVGKLQNGAVSLPHVEKMNFKLPFLSRRNFGQLYVIFPRGSGIKGGKDAQPRRKKDKRGQ